MTSGHPLRDPPPDHSGWETVLRHACRHHSREPGYPCWTGPTRALCGRRVRHALAALARPKRRP